MHRCVCAVSSTLRGDLLVVLMLQCVPRRATERNPNKHRTSEVFYSAGQGPYLSKTMVDHPTFSRARGISATYLAPTKRQQRRRSLLLALFIPR